MVPFPERRSVIGAVETLAAASPTASAAVVRRDGSTSVTPALSAAAGSAAGVVPEAAVAVAQDQPWLLWR
jgi:hypothetical protein